MKETMGAGLSWRLRWERLCLQRGSCSVPSWAGKTPLEKEAEGADLTAWSWQTWTMKWLDLDQLRRDANVEKFPSVEHHLQWETCHHGETVPGQRWLWRRVLRTATDGGFCKRRWDVTVRENSRRDHWCHQLTLFFYLVISMIEGRKGKFIAGETKDTEKPLNY